MNEELQFVVQAGIRTGMRRFRPAWRHWPSGSGAHGQNVLVVGRAVTAVAPGELRQAVSAQAALVFRAAGEVGRSNAENTDAHEGVLRTRSANSGGWERLQQVTRTGGTYGLESMKNGKYVTKDPSGDYGLLRAHADKIDGWERLTFQRADNFQVVEPDSAQPTSCTSFRTPERLRQEVGRR